MRLLIIINGILERATVYLLATEGSLIVQRAGLLNLGIEGFFAIAALVAYAVAVYTGNLVLAFIAAAASALAFNMIFTVLTVHLRLNHIVSGLAVSMLGLGLSYTFGVSLVGIPLPQNISMPMINVFGLELDPVIILSIVIAVGLWYLLYRTKLGYQIRIVGENPHVADRLGVPIDKVRYIATAIEGALVGLGAAYYSLVVIPEWSTGVTLGKGWLAIALAMFSLWHPIYAIGGSYLIACSDSLARVLPLLGVPVSPYLLYALPYVLTIVALSVVSYVEVKKKRLGIPTALAKVYSREERARKYT
ncbi:MAG: ABC transporter permease [Crenarchaeota archaeon]|nr:ABC transporter permease [Thermoproteota archaeon]